MFRTERQSFDAVDYWIEEVRGARGTSAVIAVVGNKFDSSNKLYKHNSMHMRYVLMFIKRVSLEEGEKKAANFGAVFL